MSDMVPITYRDFYDVPRMFVVERGGTMLLFDGSFDDGLDEYPDHYTAYELPRSIELSGSWAALGERGRRPLGCVPVNAVRFDPTRRASVDSTIFDLLTAEHVAAAS